MRRLIAAAILLGLAACSGCYSVTAFTANALHVGAPGKIDPQESPLAVTEIVAMSITSGPALHLRARTADGSLVHVTGRIPPAGDLLPGRMPAPARLHFERDPAPFPRGDVRIYVTDSRRRWSDGKQLATPAAMLSTGDDVHVVEKDGTVEASTTPLTLDMAERWAAVEIHLRRSARYRESRWNLVLTVPPPGGWTMPLNDLTDDTDDDEDTPSSLPIATFAAGPSYASDRSLAGPRPAEGTVLGTIAFCALCPLTVVWDTASYLVPLPLLFLEMMLADEEGYMTWTGADTGGAGDDE